MELHKKHLISIVCFFLISTNVFAASFDCKKASSKIEITICENKTISELDDRLAVFYKKVMGRLSPNLKTILKKSQREWLKKRNKESKYTLLSFYKQRVNALKIPDIKYSAKHFKEHSNIVYRIFSDLPSAVIPKSMDSYIKDLIIDRFFKSEPESFGDRFAGSKISNYKSNIMFELNPDDNNTFYLFVATHHNGVPSKLFKISEFWVNSDGVPVQ